MKESELILRDALAIERTKLASDRTFLAYFQSSIFFLATGISILNIHIFSEIPYLGWIFIGMAPIILVIGFARFRYVKRKITEMIEKFEH